MSMGLLSLPWSLSKLLDLPECAVHESVGSTVFTAVSARLRAVILNVQNSV